MSRWACLCLALSLWLSPAYAIDRLTFSVDSIKSAGWQASGLQWSMDLSSGIVTDLSISRIVLPEPYGEVKSLEIKCPELLVKSGNIECRQGRATAVAPWLGSGSFALAFKYEAATQSLDMEITGMTALGGKVDIAVKTASSWTVAVTASRVSAEQLRPWMPLLGEEYQDWQLGGQFDLQMDVSPETLAFELSAGGLNVSDPLGKYASEGLVLGLNGGFRRVAGGWRGALNAKLPGGQAYIEPIFADFAANSADISINLQYDDDGSIEVEDALLIQDAALEARLSGHWERGQWQALTVKMRKAQLATVYELYAKPYLLGSSLESLQAGGEVDLDLTMAASVPQSVHVQLRDVVVEDRQGRFAWDALQGDIHWQQEGQAPVTRLSWAGGAAYKLLFGPSSLQARLGGKSASLEEPLHLPLLEGALVIRELAAQDIGADNMALRFDGELEPLKLEALTTVLGWPAFGGQLSGRLPDLEYKSGVMTLGGALQAEVFDGKVMVEKLRIQDPFGDLPQMFADIRLRNLELEAVTQAFSFGRIEGRLDGDVEQLQMLNWQPVAFNAHLGTPEDDDSRHRISQRAIENISAIGGGGAGAVLSRGFLQFFEDFAYDRIGLSCRLAGGVCVMGGLGPSKDGLGYVLVKGRLLPRIDVIGYASEVDWKTLVEQLKSVTEGEGPELR